MWMRVFFEPDSDEAAVSEPPEVGPGYFPNSAVLVSKAVVHRRLDSQRAHAGPLQTM